MLTRAEAEAFATEWIAAWNSRDLTRVLSHYDDDFEFSSPVIIDVVGEPSGKLRGKEAVGAYWAKALARISQLHFQLETLFIGVDSIVIHYSRHDGRVAAEWFELGANGKVRRSSGNYAA